MMGFLGAANPGMMNFPNTIHINPKFAGNAQMQQEMMMFQQQQQWQQAQQAMAFQRANAMGMPQFYNNQQQRNSPNTQKPHGGYRPNKEVSPQLTEFFLYFKVQAVLITNLLIAC
jgi:hypothetical protein